MADKYDLKSRKKEIRDDEAFFGKKDERISQADILRMIEEKSEREEEE